MSLFSDDFWPELTMKVCVADDIRDMGDKSLQNDLEEILKRKIRRSFRIYPFGSRVMGVAEKSSDFDVYVEFNNSFNEYASSNSPCANQLQRQSLIRNALSSELEWDQLINYGGRVPIVKVRHRPTLMQCDISFADGLTYSQNKLVMFLFDLQPVARYMVIYLRGWIKSNQYLTEFRSHLLILMVIFFLQIQNHLPGINRLQENLPPTMGPWVTTFNKLSLADFMMTEISVNEHEIRNILRDFFDFYAKFKFQTYAIYPYLGKYVQRNRLNDQLPSGCLLRDRDNKFTRFPTAIQDFMFRNYNKGWLIKTHARMEFQAQCAKEVA